MFGKPEWFARRKYLGWGLMPKTWQGWVYTVAIVLPIVLIQFIPQLDERGKNILLVAWAILIVLDVVDIMAHMRSDERERIHEAFAERNALWAMMLVLVMGISFQVAQSVVQNGTYSIDPVILAAIFIGLAAKAGTNLYLDRKN